MPMALGLGLSLTKQQSTSAADPMVALLAALTGTNKFVWDTTYNNSSLVTQGAGVATALAEVNGGPTLTMTGSPVWDGALKTITMVGASSQCADTATVATIKADGDWSLYLIGAFNSSGQVCCINAGALAKFVGFGNVGGTFTQASAGATQGLDAPTQTCDTNSATMRLGALVHGGLDWAHPASGTEFGGRDGANVNCEYSYVEQRGRGRGALRNGVVQKFAAGSCRLTIGANADHSAFVGFVLKGAIYLDHQASYTEQAAINAFALARGCVMTSTRPFVCVAGNSVIGGANGSIGTAFGVLLQSASPSPFAGTYAAAFPTATWDTYDDSRDVNGGREGQFLTQIRGVTNRARDAYGGGINTLRPKNVFVYSEGFNDGVNNSTLTSQQRGQVGIDSAIRALLAAREAGYSPIIMFTIAKATNPSVPDPGTPFNIGLDPAGALPAEARRYVYNNFWRANWRTYCDGLVDPAGNIELRHTDSDVVTPSPTTSWGGTYGTAGTLYTAVNLPHPNTPGDIEFVFNPAVSVYTAAYAAAYTLAWPASPYPIVSIDGPLKVSYWQVLHDLGVV